MNAEKFVKGIFPDATVASVAGGQYELRGVPGLVCRAVSEAHTWQAAARDMADPVLEAARKMAADEQALLPCPFCGSDDLLHLPVPTVSCGVQLQSTDPHARWAVICNGCGSNGPAENNGGEIQGWNTRSK